MKEKIEKEKQILESLWEEQRKINDKIQTQRKKVEKLINKYNESRTLTLEEILNMMNLIQPTNIVNNGARKMGFLWPDTTMIQTNILYKSNLL